MKIKCSACSVVPPGSTVTIIEKTSHGVAFSYNNMWFGYYNRKCFKREWWIINILERIKTNNHERRTRKLSTNRRTA